MKEIESGKVKNFGYRLGQALAIVTIICLMALIIGVTIGILCRIF